MKKLMLVAAAALLAAGAAAAAQDEWPLDGWGPGLGGGMGLGRTEGPLTVDLWQVEGGSSLSVTVSGCGGPQDYRSFGTDIAAGEGETRAPA
ncbi:MAG: hypothetical protein M3177_10165, partial [Pseudomonadota bacterium]|nr:hypothetical protein [Pseudomonadota bacterium]